jgi:C4-dicarboxylate-specific signal transduction histidine kinase
VNTAPIETTMEFFRELLASDFMPHSVCFLWNAELLWLHAISDTIITISYYLIPVALVYFVRKRADLPFNWIPDVRRLHLRVRHDPSDGGLDAVAWHLPARGVIKAVTAVASVATPILLIRLLPQALALPSPAQLRQANVELETEISYRRRAERTLLDAHGELEARVQQRTVELADANEELRTEIGRRERSDQERVSAQHALTKLQADLAHVARVTTMGELAASIAHEVNQPLTAVVTNANAGLRWLAAERPNVAEVRGALQRIVRDGQRAADVLGRIRELLVKSPPRPAPQDVNALLEEVLSLLRDSLASHHVEVHLELAGNLPLVLGDRVQLQQVILNLVLNGVDAMSIVSDRPRRLRIASRVLDDGQIAVSVTDSGVGVDPTVFERLFEPFFTTKANGMGMGSSVCRSIVQRHGGQLWASINEGGQVRRST